MLTMDASYNGEAAIRSVSIEGSNVGHKLQWVVVQRVQLTSAIVFHC